MMTSMSGTAVAPGMVSFSILRTLFSGLASLDHLLRREVLRDEIFGPIRHAEFVSPTIHHRVTGAKIIGRGRRRDTPFQCGGAPEVALFGLIAAGEARQKIDEDEPMREN